VCWRRALLFFFLGSGEREREGEQVLLTWALGPSANKEGEQVLLTWALGPSANIVLLVTHCVDGLLITTMQPPPSFLVTMEEYIREAPRADIEVRVW
jgi:hypothetical protein